MESVLKILKFFLVWRVLLFIPVILSVYILEYGTSYPFFEITYHKNLPYFLALPIFTAWSNFDGVHYLNIASEGYESGGRFFPLFSILIYILSLGSMYFPLTFIISLIIPNVIFIAALFVYLKLLKLDYPQKSSFQTILYLIIFPTSFFFIAVYSEGLFLLLTLLSFLFMRKRSWLVASFFVAFLTATRFVGIAIIPALIFEYLISEKPRILKSWMTLFLISLTSALGLISYSIYNYFHWGNFLHFIAAQGELNNGRSTSGFVFPLQTVYRYSKILTTLPLNLFEWWIALLELASFIFAVIFLFIAWRKKIRMSYLIFGAGALLLPCLSGTFSGLPRYLLVIFPIFIPLGLIKSNSVKLIYSVVSLVLLVVLLMFFSRGYFVA